MYHETEDERGTKDDIESQKSNECLRLRKKFFLKNN